MPRLRSVNPVNGELVLDVEEHSERDIELRLTAAAAASGTWRVTPIEQRAAVLQAVAGLLEQERESFGRLMTQEMGKTLTSAVAEADKCALTCRYYAEHIAAFTATEPVVTGDAERGWVRYDPLGAVLAVMPWNFPFWQVIRFAAPALAAGNVALLKHASNVPRCAIALDDLFQRAGAPPGVFQTLLIGSSRVDAVIADARVHAVTLTGSEGAGRSVAATAGHHLKKTVLELGGSDPFIVCASANVERAADVAVAARCINIGQSCIAAKRFIVVEEVADAFLGRFVDRMRALRVGDPMEPGTELGPLALASLRDDLHRQVQESVAAGARLVTGGEALDGAGWFYQPTVLADIPAHAPAYSEELFGPVAMVFRVPDLTAAIALANDTRFGLAASVWTTDDSEAELCAASLECGSVFVNAMVASDPRFPFGGIKACGYGREMGLWGLREFVIVWTVRVFGEQAEGEKTRRKEDETTE
jgi:succinate-semialdehyde dehydrogenase/glutarate-semialdehyde dehydrogenase